MSLTNESKDYIVLKGRAGLEYYDEKGRGYFIDSEMIASDKYDYAIYIDSVVSLDNNLSPTKEIRHHIMKRVEYLCKVRNMKPWVFNDNKMV